MRPAQGIQRGGVANGNGDPSTPGWPSVAGAKRLSTADLSVPHIPVVPIGYGNAALLLRDLRGTPIAAAWQGGLPFRYRVGPGPVRARVAIATDARRRCVPQPGRVGAGKRLCRRRVTVDAQHPA